MTLSEPRGTAARRPAFTLVEVLIAITIILILVSMLAVALRGAFTTGKVVQTRTEMAQLASAVAAFKLRFPMIDSIPDRMDSTTATAALKRMYPRWTGTINLGSGVVLEGDQCLVFFLAGPPRDAAGALSPSGYGVGWPAGSSSPIPTASPGNETQFFQFPTQRLKMLSELPAVPTRANADGSYRVYLDPWAEQPYVFFSNANGVLVSPDLRSVTLSNKGTDVSVTPYIDALTNRYANPNGIQLISAGPDRLIAPGGVFNPGQGVWGVGGVGRDDIANFWPEALGNSIQ